MMIDIEKLRALEKAATPGPWVNPARSRCIYRESEKGRKIGETHFDAYGFDYPTLVESQYNAELITVARNALPDLLNLLEEARRLVWELRLREYSPSLQVQSEWWHRCEAFLAKLDAKREG